MNPTEIEEKLRKRLRAHDWYYSRASDHNKWSEGSSNEHEIDRLMKMLPKGVAQAIYNEYAPKPEFPAKAPIIRRMRRKSSNYVYTMAVTPEEKRSSGINLPGKHIVGNAVVADSASVYGNAVVHGNAQVSGDVKVWDKARIGGDAQVYGAAQVIGSADVYGKAQIYGRANVSGNAQVFGNAKIRGKAQVYGKSVVCGKALVQGSCLISGDAVIHGNANIGGNAVILGGEWDGSEGEVTTGRWKAPGVPDGESNNFTFLQNPERIKHNVLCFDGLAFLIGDTRKRRKGVNLGPCERNQTAVRNLLSDYLLIDPRDLVPTKF